MHVFAGSVPGIADTLPPTHRAFVDSALSDLASRVLAGFRPNRTRPLTLVPDSSGDPDSSFYRAAAEILTAQRILMRAAETEASNGWVMQYHLDSAVVTLFDPHRRKFLGSVWVERRVHPAVTVSVYDQVDTTEVWRGTADSVYSDSIQRRDLKHLESRGIPGLSPEAPNNAWDRAVIPLAVGIGATVITAILLIAR